MQKLVFTLIVMSSFFAGAQLIDTLSQNDTIHLNLQIPPELVTEQGIVGNALDRLDLANHSVGLKLNNASKCKACDDYAAGKGSSLSFTYGNGRSYDKDITGGGEQKWDFDLRLSRSISDNCLRIDTGIINEGHPSNHHRDGIYLQLTCSKKVLKNLSAEVSLGPYFGMDTTTPKGGTELDQKEINILASAALKYYLGKSGLHVRFECDGVKSTSVLTKGPNSIQCMAGFGKDFSKPDLSDLDDTHKYSLETGPVWSKTNHGGTLGAFGTSIGISRYDGPWVSRLGLLSTGNDGSVNDLKGVTGEVDYMIPVGKSGKDFLYSGAGVYLARNYQSDSTDVSASLTFLGYQHDFKNNFFFRVDYDRIAKLNNAPVDQKKGDADVLRGQIGYKF